MKYPECHYIVQRITEYFITCFLYKKYSALLPLKYLSDEPASQKKVNQWTRQSQNLVRDFIKTTFSEQLLADDPGKSLMA